LNLARHVLRQRDRLLRCAAALLACVLVARCGSGGSGGPVPPSPPQQPPPGGTTTTTTITPAAPQVFVGTGDIAVCGAQGTEATARLIDNTGGTVFTLGDNAYFQGSARDYRECYDPTWGRNRGRTRPSPGNHEYESPGAAPYYEYFGPQAGPPGLGYYSFPVGAWHAVSLNSNLSGGAMAAQLDWLRNDLGSTSARCTIAYWHHPLVSSGPNGDHAHMRDAWRVLYEAGADVIMSGHDHLYERYALQDPDTRPDPVRGIRQFIVGTGGATPYQFMNTKLNSDRRITGQFGVLKLTLSDSYQWEFVTPSGVADSGSGTCH
jgi:hypothetical protein